MKPRSLLDETAAWALLALVLLPLAGLTLLLAPLLRALPEGQRRSARERLYYGI